jgi:acyl dehydratase
MSITTVSSIERLEELVGTELGPTEPRTLDQATIDAFADATGDHQWIHVDRERAAAGPFGTTIGHGLFTLSLGPVLMEELIRFEGFAHVLNYGYGKVRFPSPVPVDSRIRMRLGIASVERVPGGGAQLTVSQTFERDGGEKPICVAESLARIVES